MTMAAGSRFEIKVCGIRDTAIAERAWGAGADYLGLVFAPSVRQVSLEQARVLARSVEAAWVGVFVDAPADDIARVHEAIGLTAIQLHGRETVATSRSIAARLPGVHLWKAVRGAAPVAEAWAPFHGIADRVLVDSGAGSGRSLDWKLAGEGIGPAPRTIPVLLAGGLTPANVARAIERVCPDGVDASSGLESAPGVKDATLVEAFVGAAKGAAALRAGVR